MVILCFFSFWLKTFFLSDLALIGPYKFVGFFSEYIFCIFIFLFYFCYFCYFYFFWLAAMGLHIRLLLQRFRELLVCCQQNYHSLRFEIIFVLSKQGLIQAVFYINIPILGQRIWVCLNLILRKLPFETTIKRVSSFLIKSIT